MVSAATGDGGERFHLDAGLAAGAHARFDAGSRRVSGVELDVDVRERAADGTAE